MSRPRGDYREALFHGNGIARKLVIALVLFSSLLTALITAVELSLEYRRDRSRIDQSIAFVGSSFLPALAESVWVSDGQQIQAQLDGLLRLPDLEYIAIQVDGRTRWSAGSELSTHTVRSEIPLSYRHRGEERIIGSVRVTASVDAILDRLWEQLLVILAFNALKTFLVALFLLLVFQQLVTRHLHRLAGFVRRLDPAQPQGEQVQLQRPQTGRWRPDMLDAIGDAINGLSRAVHRSRLQLIDNEGRLLALTRHSTAYICEIDREGRIVFANRPHPGLAHSDVIDTKLADVFPQALRPTLERALGQVLAGGGLQQLEYTVADAAQSTRSFLAALAPIVRGEGVATAALTAVDVTTQKAAEAQIRDINLTLEQRVRERTRELNLAKDAADHANRAKSEFLSGMSHQLRTPLHAVLGFSQLLEMAGLDAKSHGFAREIRRAGDHLLQLINDLLDLSRIEAGQLHTHLQTLDAGPVIERSMAIVQPLLQARGLTLELAPGPVPCRVRADPLRLHQILVNLLSNAVKYNRENGSIGVSCQAHGERVRILVEDSGPGLDEQQVALLFSPFERLGAQRTAVEGSGIGLALSRRLAQMMEATMGVRSTPGVGSVFWVELPGAGAAPDAAARAPER